MDIYFLIAWELVDDLLLLSDEALGKIMRAIFAHKRGAEPVTLEGNLAAVFNLVKRAL